MSVCHYPDLNNKVVFITGGGSGIGATIINGFLSQGAKVACVSLEPVPAPLSVPHPLEPLHFFYQQCDVRHIEQLTHCIREAEQKLGHIDILVNNAANDVRHTLEELSPEQWDDSLNTNLRPYFFTAQALAAAMKEKQQGSIINISSNSALLGLSGYPAYVAAKSAIIGMSRALARELGGHNIRVNSLIPGWVMTEKQQQLWATEEALEQCKQQQCLKTLVQEVDIANGVLFLASSASSMITAQSLVIDGGRA